MRPPRRIGRGRPQRARFFLGCEGEGERGYAALLQELSDEAERFIHLDPVLLQPGGGDPLAIIEKAAEEIDRRERRFGEPYADRFILLDRDKVGLKPQRDQRGEQIATDIAATLIWQDPAHEALLLRHLEGHANDRPPTTRIALQRLRQFWPGYRKPMSAKALGERIDLAGAQRAAAADIDPGFAALLASLGL